MYSWIHANKKDILVGQAPWDFPFSPSLAKGQIMFLLTCWPRNEEESFWIGVQTCSLVNEYSTSTSLTITVLVIK